MVQTVFFQDQAGQTAILKTEPCKRRPSHVSINVEEFHQGLRRYLLTYAVMLPAADEAGVVFEFNRALDKVQRGGYRITNVQCSV